MSKLTVFFMFILSVPSLFAAKVPVKEQHAFVRRMRPKIAMVDKQILKDRNIILLDRKSLMSIKHLPYSDYEEIFKLGAYYKVADCDPEDWDEQSCIKDLLKRVDILPPNLILAQAINESNWGQSRFALQGNNYFGIWCFRKGCGLVPGARPKGQTYEVRRFANAEESIAAYYRNINTHDQYQDLRDQRYKMRELGKPLNALTLAEGLEGYSTRKKAYVRSIQSLIRRLES